MAERNAVARSCGTWNADEHPRVDGVGDPEHWTRYWSHIPGAVLDDGHHGVVHNVYDHSCVAIDLRERNGCDRGQQDHHKARSRGAQPKLRRLRASCSELIRA